MSKPETYRSLQRQFTDDLLNRYQRTGEEVGYWATRHLQALRRLGGVERARRMLQPRTASQRSGLDRLIDAGRADLTVEYAVLRPRFRPLFGPEEIRAARERLAVMTEKITARRVSIGLYPEVLEGDARSYIEGARRLVAINWFERSAAARSACVKHYGYRCAACEILMEDVYGKRGKSFIHVHHLRPAALRKREYVVDHVKDLRPVCPNCHAMLHRGKKVVSIEQLRSEIARSLRRSRTVGQPEAAVARRATNTATK